MTQVGNKNELRFFKESMAETREDYGMRNVTLANCERSPNATEVSELSASARREGSFLLDYKMKRQKMLEEMDDMRKKDSTVKLPSVRGGEKWDTDENHNKLLRGKC